MADLILDCALDAEVARFYHNKFRPSALISGAFEAEDFFPHFGERGKWLFFTAAPLSDANGNFIGAIETLQDVTEKKMAEQALLESENKFKAMSMTDALTSLFNSRHFYERSANEIERATRFSHPLALMLLDLDDFKRLNDTHGHLEGDKALVTTANVIRSVLRTVDAAFRYGGEEFVVLLPETDLESAAMVAERLRHSLAGAPITTAAGVSLNITASIGVAAYCPPETIQDFVRRADDGVYEAKRQGKNKVIARRATGGGADPDR